MELNPPAEEERKVFEDGGGKDTFSGADFDEVPRSGFFQGCGRPSGDRAGRGLGKGGSRGEIPSAADSFDPPGIVAGLRIVESAIHELFEGLHGVRK